MSSTISGSVGDAGIGSGYPYSSPLTITSTGSVAGDVYANNSAATLVNFGKVSGGVYFLDGGYADNKAGVLSGFEYGVFIGGTVGTVVNAGTIEETGSGPFSYIGLDLHYGGTAIDSGRISGTTAVYMGGSGSNLLELEHGYSISGSIVGGGNARNTLELSGAAGAVSVSFDGLAITNFHTVEFASPSGGNDETLVVSNTAHLPGTIESFTAFHDIVDLTGVAYHVGATVTEGGNDKLTLVSGSETLSLQLAGSYSGIVWLAKPDGGTGTDIEPACFARGTRILCEGGERPVERMAIGDRVVTHRGKVRPIKWIGRRTYRGAFLMRNSAVWPILVKAGALGPGMPRRDLHLSAKHALFSDGVLIPVECLVNGGTVLRCECPDEIEYFHIELGGHDVILAEGAPAETFLDCDNRGIFHNWHEFAELYREEAPAGRAFCAPRLEAGRPLARIRARLAARAAVLLAAA